MRILYTLVPFLIFLAIVFRHEMKYRRRERRLTQERERYMGPLARTANNLYERTYGRPCEEMQRTFPGIRSAK